MQGVSSNFIDHRYELISSLKLDIAARRIMYAWLRYKKNKVALMAQCKIDYLNRSIYYTPGVIETLIAIDEFAINVDILEGNLTVKELW